MRALLRISAARSAGIGAEELALGVATLLLAVAFWPAFVANGDGTSMLEVAKAMVAGHLDVPCNDSTIRVGDGCYSTYYPLQSVLAAPIVLLVRAFPLGGATDGIVNTAVHVVPVVATAGTVLLVRLMARDLGASSRAATVAALTALCTPLLAYSRSFFAEALATCMLALTVYGCSKIERREVAASVGLVGLVLTKPQLVFVAGAVVIIACWGKGLRSWIVGAGSIGLAAGLNFVYNAARFGDPLDFGGQARSLHGDRLSPAQLLDSLALLMVSPGRGFLVYSPIIAVGLVLLLKSQRLSRFSLIIFAACAAALAVALLNPGGGVNWGTRYLIPIVPLGAVGLAFLTPSHRLVAAALAGWGLAVSLPTLIVPFESAYRSPVAAGQAPSSIYWSIRSGPIVELWNQFPSVLSSQDLWVVWWRELPPSLTWIGAVGSFALLLIAAWLIRHAHRRQSSVAVRLHRAESSSPAQSSSADIAR